MNQRFNKRLFHRILTTTVLCLAAVVVSGCTKLNLVEQLNPEDRRVPIVDANPKRFTLFELNGSYYVPLTVYMGKEDVPILGWRSANVGGPFSERVSYTPDPTTAQVWLFPLSDKEATECLEELHPNKTDIAVKQEHDIDTAPIIASSSFDFKRARVCGKVRMFCPQSVQANQNGLYYSTPRLPVEKGTRSFGYYVAYGPVWCVDAVGNVAIGAAEAAVAAPFAVILVGMLAILPHHGVL